MSKKLIAIRALVAINRLPVDTGGGRVVENVGEW